MMKLSNPISKRKDARGEQLKRAILAAFSCHEDEVPRLLGGFDETTWRSVMWWLDVSGTALYLLRVIRRACAEQAIPPAILNTLQDRQAHNSVRSHSLFMEASALCGWLNDAGIAYALLKGITLSPHSVPEPAARCQADLDLMIARRDLRVVRHYVSRLGYRLHADTGRTLEFRAGECGKPDIAKIYSVHMQRALELHVVDDHAEILARRCIRQIEGVALCSLSPEDILVQQATHILKHLCGEHTRVSWILEFRRHVQAREGDARFWCEVQAIASRTRNGDVALGVALWLSKHLFGPMRPGYTARWNADCLPDRVKLWLTWYSERVFLSDSGSKCYALLRNEVATEPGEARSTRSILLPACLPFVIRKPATAETPRQRASRYVINAGHCMNRLRFHLVEGARFAVEASRWRKAVAGMRKSDGSEYRGAVRAATRAGCVALLMLAGCALLPMKVQGQSATGSQSQYPSLVPRDELPKADDVTTTEQESSASSAMPAADLIQVLEKNPQVMVESKSIIADALQQQGKSVTAETITDDQVYDGIESSSEVRKTLTRFLLSRGYISEEQVQAASLRARSNVAASARTRESADVDTDQNLTEDTSASAYPEPGARRSKRPSSSVSAQTEVETQRSAEETSTAAHNVTDEPDVLRRSAPYNLLSLRDLYTQVPDTPEQLKRFGSDVFVTRGRKGNSLDGGVNSLDVPVGPDYVLGPGDELSINLWGGVSESLLRPVDREGAVALPEAGLVQVAGLTMGKAQSVIEQALRSQYRDAHVAVTIARLRSIRIFVVGDVQRPGSYEISSVASAVSALYAAGGPTAVGSLRVLRHLRNEKLIGEIDLYDFMLHGVKAEKDGLQSGDTLLVPPVGPQVAIFGAVKRPAIYELRNETSLEQVLESAGGVTAAAALTRITVDRVVANQGRREIGLNADFSEEPSLTRARLGRFEVKDGDRVHVATVLPVNDRVVYLQGHVARPGKIAYRDNMRVSDVLRSYGDMLPEPAETGEIVRLVAPDMHPETIEFNVADVLIGNSGMTLQPFDTVRVFGRYEQDAPTVTIRGEVQRPGEYPLFDGMTASQLVRAAGGFKRDALLSRADLTSYEVVDGARVTVSRRDVAIGAVVLKQDREADVQLKAGDALTVHQISGWNDVGASIIIEGEVAHPGSYGFQEGEHLSDVLKRAGGFRDTAYPEGAVLTRPEVAQLEEKSRDELIRQIETSSAAARLSARGVNGDQGASLQLIQQQQDQVLAQLKDRPATGRLVIHITQELNTWAGTAADVEVRRGDVLKVPKRPGFVLVSGQVYNASAITYTPNQTAEWYLQKAGGATQIADRKHIFVVRANGEVIGRHSNAWYEHDVLSTRLEAGDTVVVPQKIQGPSVVWRNLLATAQVAASITLAASVVGGL